MCATIKVTIPHFLVMLSILMIGEQCFNVNKNFPTKMNSQMTMSTYDIIMISLNVAILLVVILSFFKAHTGDCRGTVVTKTKTPDGCVTREAKLSMREKGHTNTQQNLMNNH